MGLLLVPDASWGQKNIYGSGRHEYQPLRDSLHHDSLSHILHEKGHFEGHARSYFMSTLNEGDFPDYVAYALGAGIGYRSPVMRGFQVGISGYVIYNLYSSDLSGDDGFSNRYEIALFDITDPHSRRDMDRFEELWLAYHFGRSKVTLGKMKLVTPFLNPQDGRMRPNLQEGLWADIREWDKVKLKGGVLWSNSPRGTVEWYSMGESIGLFPNGRSPAGMPAEYKAHVHSNYLAIGHVGLTPVPNLQIDVWNYYADRLFNMFFTKAIMKRDLTAARGVQWTAGAQFLLQNSLYKAGNTPLKNQYIFEGENTHAFSGRLGLETPRQDIYLNATHISSRGRFLFPREWGREPFFTFITRERAEGQGGAQGVSINYHRKPRKLHQLEWDLAAGAFRNASVENLYLNKYGIPSYAQLNAHALYRFPGFFQGLHAGFLYAVKTPLGSVPEGSAYRHNKVNMHHVNVIFDYHF